MTDLKKARLRRSLEDIDDGVLAIMAVGQAMQEITTRGSLGEEVNYCTLDGLHKCIAGMAEIIGAAAVDIGVSIGEAEPQEGAVARGVLKRLA